MVKTDRKHREFFYDGKTPTLFGRRVNYYATVPAPPGALRKEQGP